jgi:TPR repeat protein
MVGRNGVLGILIAAAVGTLFLVPAHGSAQDSLSVSCDDAVWFSLLEHLPRCASQGDARAQYLLGLRYADGEGVPQDDTQAARWFRLSAEQGHARAQFSLGRMYRRGDGVPEDLIFAYMWWTLSASTGHEIARVNRDIIERRMTREQIAEAERLSREWIEEHPQDGGN